MADDLEFAKAEFNTALPNWWYVIEESEAEFSVTIGSNDDADDTHTYRVLKPASAAEALGHATRACYTSRTQSGSKLI